MPDWPHSPVHRLGEAGAYMVTASTYKKQLLFNSASRLTLVRDTLFALVLSCVSPYNYARARWNEQCASSIRKDGPSGDRLRCRRRWPDAPDEAR